MLISVHPRWIQERGLDMHSIVLEPDQPFDLDLTLSCGQVFGWEREGDAWRGVVGRDLVRIAQRGDRLSFSGADPSFIRHYFGLDLDLPEVLSSIDRDPVIPSCDHPLPGPPDRPAARMGVPRLVHLRHVLKHPRDRKEGLPPAPAPG